MKKKGNFSERPNIKIGIFGVGSGGGGIFNYILV